jgi:predicted histone-like DNA-binding protein
MAINFEWYDTPVPSSEKENERKLHARITINGSFSAKQVREEIQYATSLTEGDVTAALAALSRVLARQLADGKQVHLEGIGYFYPTLKCKGTVTADMNLRQRNRQVQFKGIKFRADQTLKNDLGFVRLHHYRHDGHSDKLSDVEIDLRLHKYFATHKVMTRIHMQSACGFMPWKAKKELHRLVEEGKLRNIGRYNQPIYEPMPGYYGG